MSIKTRLLSVPKEEVLRGAGLALRNAESLLRDGRRLAVDSSSYPTANALFQFALEEVGKATAMCEHYRKLYLGQEVNGDALISAFSNHGQKTRKALSILEAVFRKVEVEYPEGLAVVEELIRSSAQYVRTREECLYVDLDGDRFQAPGDSIDQAVMEHTLFIANAAFNFANEYHMTLVDPEYKFLSRTSERIRKAGGPIASSVVHQRMKKPA